MIAFLKLYLKIKYPHHKRAYRLIFNPDGYHHYPKELKSQAESLVPEKLDEGLRTILKTFHPQSPEGLTASCTSLVSCIPALPSMLELAIDVTDSSKFSWRSRLHIASIVVYLVSPVDIIPETSSPGVGLADDAIFASIALKKLSPKEIERVRSMWGGSPESLLAYLNLSEVISIEIPELYTVLHKAQEKVFT